MNFRFMKKVLLKMPQVSSCIYGKSLGKLQYVISPGNLIDNGELNFC